MTSIAFRLGPRAPQCRVRVLLDGNLAYLGEFDEEYGSEMLVCGGSPRLSPSSQIVGFGLCATHFAGLCRAG